MVMGCIFLRIAVKKVGLVRDLIVVGCVYVCVWVCFVCVSLQYVWVCECVWCVVVCVYMMVEVYEAWYLCG